MVFKSILFSILFFTTQVFGVGNNVRTSDFEQNVFGGAAFIFPTVTPTNGRVCQFAAGGEIESSTVTNAELAHLAGVSGDIQTQLNTKIQQGGNAFGATETIGTTDNQIISVLQNNTERMRIGTAGVSFGLPAGALQDAVSPVHIWANTSTSNINASGLIVERNENSVGSSGPSIVLRRSRGTGAAPTAALSSDTEGFISWQTHDGVSYNGTSNVQIFASATEPFTSTGHGSQFGISAAPNGSVSRTTRFRIEGNGEVNLGPNPASNPSANLELSRTDGALLLNRVADAAVVTPVNGMTKYRPSDNRFNVYQNGAWKNILAGQADLTSEVTGTLPIANGGTGAATTSQNLVFAGPTSGSGAPSFRALVTNDLPTMPSFIQYSSGPLNSPSITSQQIMLGGKAHAAMVLQNLEGSASILANCTTNPTVVILDCGASATCAGATTAATVTISAADTITDGTLPSPSIASGNYWAVAVTAAACTSLDFSISAGVKSP